MTHEELRSARKELGLSQLGLARKLGLSLSVYGNYERNRDRQSGRPAPVPKAIELAILYLLSRKHRNDQ
jgi:transcriptional regulator with XRE-family HTH domain